MLNFSMGRKDLNEENIKIRSFDIMILFTKKDIYRNIQLQLILQ